ncbi:hypothetical protein GCM10007989_28920 [Devosia pacifica]|uniref:Ricin B lectin domain-containing protein n=1 Tax=Devosia pacifica TaxID=1335967 RepID=A0A918VUU8_9HYPH|nr:hypothetical protein [Devosia pacifica]GHA31190.1 hypothetical protein GCM10007989_28920 [Devosia pacifica]
MLLKSAAVAALGAGLAFAAPAPASLAQDQSIYACTSQQDLQQTIESDGSIVPDSCRTVNISTLTNDSGQLCLVEFGDSGGGIISQVQDFAGPQQLWFICEDLQAAAE